MPKNSQSPLVSIIIVNYNGLQWLDGCFTSIKNQTYKNIETVFVDNGSKDTSIEYIKRHFPSVVIVENSENLGFAEGNNTGYEKCSGEYIYLLNNDTTMEPDCVAKLVEFMEASPKVGSAQSKMLRMKTPERLDVVGAFWTFTGFLYYYGSNSRQDDAKFSMPIPVYSNKGASMLLRQSAIEKVGLFDKDFWCYYEEGDLCARLWLSGYECWYAPEAVMSHAGGGTALTFENSFIQFHNFKNKMQSFLKCHQLWTLIKVLPLYLALNIVISFYWLAKGKVRHFLSLYKALGWNMYHFSHILKKRHAVQSLRQQSDKQIFAKVQRSPRWGYYLSLLTGRSWEYED